MEQDSLLASNGGGPYINAAPTKGVIRLSYEASAWLLRLHAQRGKTLVVLYMRITRCYVIVSLNRGARA